MSRQAARAAPARSPARLGARILLAVGWLLAGGPLVAIPAALAAPSWLGEHDAAVRQARAGDTAAALVILERLQREHPDDLSVARDRVVVAGWAGQDEAVIRLYRALPPGPQPAYVIEAVGHAYRNLHQPSEALALYRAGSRQYPADDGLVAGEIRSMVDLGEFEPAAARADDALRQRGEKLEILLAAGVVAMARDLPVEAVRYDDRALRVDPTSRDARHDRILAIAQMGAPQVARQLADASPGLLSPAEYRHVEGSEAAALVRWGVAEPPSEAERFAATDRAIAMLDGLIARWSSLGADAHDDVLRARFDRMVALRDRVRMLDVLAEYDDLRRNGVEIPSYALEAAGDAYLYLRQPELARDLYRRVLVGDPKNFDARLALFYAYVDLEEFHDAYQTVDALDADLDRWLYLKGLRAPIPNPGKDTADLAAASARQFGDQLAEAQRRFEAIGFAAPNNTRYIAGLGNIDAARGWPRLADDEYAIGRWLKPVPGPWPPQDLDLEVGQARDALTLQNFRGAEAQAADLTARFPENLEVQRLDRLWDVHNMWELNITAEQAWRSSTNVAGGSGITIGSQIYTPPIGYDWRLFAGESYAHEGEPSGEGMLLLHRSDVGVEYRHLDLTASLEGDFNSYRKQDPINGSDGQQKLGGVATATYQLNDYWQIGGTGELFSHDTPLRALRSGVTADSAAVNLTYRESESRSLQLVTEAMPFSDGNFRSSESGTYTERLLAEPRFTIDGIGGLALSQNSDDQDRHYFNPSQDALATFGAAIDQTLYRRYEFIYDHRLVVTPGVYWQDGYGYGGVFSVQYQQRLRVNDVFDFGVGVGYGLQPYDGVYENTIILLAHLNLRF
jgi:biofilm PGA synthesis protein PgaA